MPKTDVDTEALARRLRIHALRMVHRSRTSHIASSLSMTDLLAVLYGSVLRYRADEPAWPGRDRLVISKGHAAAVVYAVLAESGFFPLDKLERYGEDGQSLSGHVTHSGNPGVELSTGSLGHGLSVAAGFALAAARRRTGVRAFAILSDGECDEGSVWEAALFAAHHRLGNLMTLVDYNKIQSFGRVEDVLALEPFADKWRAFGWHVQEIDGHNHEAIRGALASADGETRPTVVIAHTIKGKGVPFMENDLLWHYRPPSDDQLAEAMRAVEGR